MVKISSSAKKVVVGLSGGVDSSVAALLLKRAGFEVLGIFMKNWSDTKDAQGVCTWRKEREDALRVATQIGIPFQTVDFEKEYKEKVYSYMIREYARANTPNPDILCNKEIKFGLFLKKAKDLGADYVATGHYARIKKEMVTVKKKRVQKYFLYKGSDPQKDQSYFLYRLNQKVLAQVLFPIGDLNKTEVRIIAQKAGLFTAEKKDSQGICFVGKVTMREFLADKIPSVQGKIINTKGDILGEHPGVQFFTIGQRKGIGIGGRGPYYVVERNLKKNLLVVTEDKQDSRLYTENVFCFKPHWISGVTPEMPLVCKAKIRYRQEDQVVKFSCQSPRKFLAKFTKPQWAVSSGQSVVFYKGERCLGGALIK